MGNILFCKKCGSKISKNNKSGFCNTHRDRTGKNNPFYGKKHSKETIAKLKIKCSESSKKTWEDDEYRKKVIKAISKPRKLEFKKEQSERIKKWYVDNPEQKILRSVHMKKSWELGKIPKSKKYSVNKSKAEKEIFNYLKETVSCVVNKTLHIDNKYFFPDIIIEDIKLIIEYFGDYWHANPYRYNSKDIINNCIAQDIWNKDSERLGIFEKAGYHVYVIWESDFKKFKNEIFKELDHMINWDSCWM